MLRASIHGYFELDYRSFPGFSLTINIHPPTPPLVVSVAYATWRDRQAIYARHTKPLSRNHVWSAAHQPQSSK